MMRRLCHVLPVAVLVTAGALASTPSQARASFGLESFTAPVTNENGTPDTQAGSHPYELTTTFAMKTKTLEGGAPVADGELKDLAVNLPVGLIGDPMAAPRCGRVAFGATDCPDDLSTTWCRRPASLPSWEVAGRAS
ncbi:MAG: hypothetical protein ABSB69_16205 [Solirubrobacteraceae bacterium]